MKNLRSAGLVGNNLFPISGDLVTNYNRVMERVTGKKTGLTSFSIDKRGISPEIEEEIGRNYLQCGPANRYMIIISPNQQNAELLDEEFSFDNQLFDSVFEQYLPGISAVTRVDGMYGRINTRLDAYDNLEDLLLLQGASIELHTPSNFIVQANALQAALKELEANPDLLVKKDGALPKKILELVSQVGDVRGYNLGDFTAYKEVGSFFTRLFDGVYVFREMDASSRKKIRRPDSSVDPRDIDIVPVNATVIYNQTMGMLESGPKVDFIPLQATEQVINFLIDKKYVVLSDQLIESRLTCLEELNLLQQDYDVAKLSKEQRMELFSQGKKPSSEWKELKELQKAIMKGYDLERALDYRNTDPNVKAMLLENNLRSNVDNFPIVANLLTKLWPWDLPATNRYNKGDLEILFDKSNAKTQRYIVSVLKN